MDIVDRDLERAEVEATRTWSQNSKERRLSQEADRRRSRQSALSSSDSDSISSSVDMNRIQTASVPSVTRTSTAARIRTHPMEMHRTQTHALQQSETVGGSKSRAETKPLPEFGGGKPYPPPLPDQEEYVVEFDGKDDPLHPMNWPFKKKYVILCINPN